MISSLLKFRNKEFSRLIQTFWISSSLSRRSGKIFELKTNNENRLIEKGFIRKKINPSKYGYYLSLQRNDTEIIYASQNGMRLFIEQEYGKELFRYPDEAYLIRHTSNISSIYWKPILKILEKKSQYSLGSADTKLWSGPVLKREYEWMLGPGFEVHYAFCLNSYLFRHLCSDIPKYIFLRKVLEENNIPIFWGNSDHYFESLDEWIGI